MNPNILPDIELQLEGKLQFLKSMTVVDHIESLIFGMALHSSEAEVVIQLSATQMMKIIYILYTDTACLNSETSYRCTSIPQLFCNMGCFSRVRVMN